MTIGFIAGSVILTCLLADIIADISNLYLVAPILAFLGGSFIVLVIIFLLITPKKDEEIKPKKKRPTNDRRSNPNSESDKYWKEIEFWEMMGDEDEE